MYGSLPFPPYDINCDFCHYEKDDEDERGVQKAREDVVYNCNLGEGINRQFVENSDCKENQIDNAETDLHWL